jgi:competence protein ComEC
MGIPPSSDRVPRRPIVPVAICFVAGILLDRLTRLPLAGWIAIGLALLGLWAVSFLRSPHKLAAAGLLVCCIAAGGLRHHASQSISAANDIALFATEEHRPVRLTGVVATAPWIRPAQMQPLQSAWPQLDTTACDLDCRTLADGDRLLDISGRVRLRVTGHMLHAEPGDVVEVRGWIAHPLPPANPGEFDYREYLQRQGIRCILSAEHPDAVRCVGREPGWWFTREVSRVRAAASQNFVETMDARAAPIASALLLEDRTRIDEDLETAFAETGMMHVLAISGLHVAILAALCFWLARLAGLSPAATAIVVLLAVAAQTLIAGARPPILRSAIFIAILLVGRTWYRQAPMGNTLAAALLVVLLWEPSDLFDIGTQLSFLAVMGIIWWQTWTRSPEEQATAQDQLAALAAGPLRRAGCWLRDRLTESVGMMLAIWLFTAPLIAACFHLASPVGILLNVLLIPAVTLVLWCGYLSQFFLLFLPVLAGPLLTLFDWGLRGFAWIVEHSAEYRLGHVYVPGPPAWWLAGYFTLLAALVAAPGNVWKKKWRWNTLCAWGVLGLGVGLLPAPSPGLRCTFLAVGHGGAILLELPNGQTLLYDAGAIDDARRAERAVRDALWSRGLSRLDGIVVSHPDLDHFNALPALLETVPVGTLMCAPPFVGADQYNTVPVIESASAAGVSIRLIGQGDRLEMDQSASLRVLSPPFERRSAIDNAESVVLEIEYAGRRILLTGDLEAEGMDALLRMPSRKVDVLLAPHHGSLEPNSSGIARWARPDHAVVSGGRPQVLPGLQRAYGADATIWNTTDSGAITVEISPAGDVRVTSFRPPFARAAPLTTVP